MQYTIANKQTDFSKYNKDVLDICFAYAKEAHTEFGDLISALVLFGSSARQDGDAKSDIDILLIFNDVTINPSDELAETYKIISQKLIAKISKRLHITTIRYTTFIDQVRTGDPIAVNILRDGVPLIDRGFFEPFQILLRQGKMRPTYEAIWSYFNRAPTTLNNSRWHLLRACEDLYWAVTDAAHAAIMKQGITPPSPKHLPDLFDKHLTHTKQFNKTHVKTIKMFVDLYKGITKKEIKDLSGPQYENYYIQAKNFILDVESFLQKHK